MKNKWRRFSIAWLTIWLLPQAAFPQEAEVGVSVPFTLSGQGMQTRRLQTEDAGASSAAAGFRAMLYPSVKLGSHWFGYAAIQVRSEPYFFEETYSAEREVDTQVLQAFLGYTRSANSKSISG